MLILTIRTDKPEAELGLFEGETKLAYETWQAHRELSNTILKKIADLLSVKGQALEDMGGVVCFQGPGSFTGLRIGITVANAFAYSLSVPIVATTGDGWLEEGVRRLQSGQNDRIALPEYGAPVHITQQRK